MYNRKSRAEITLNVPLRLLVVYFVIVSKFLTQCIDVIVVFGRRWRRVLKTSCVMVCWTVPTRVTKRTVGVVRNRDSTGVISE